jgi:hypothetical protein
LFYGISTGGEMVLFLVLLWCSAVGRCGGANILSRHSRFGAFNSRLGRGEFPVRAATGIRRQEVDFARFLRGQMAVERGKTTKFPVQREKPGNRTLRHDLAHDADRVCFEPLPTA